jgi:hypothetical protein
MCDVRIHSSAKAPHKQGFCSHRKENVEVSDHACIRYSKILGFLQTLTIMLLLESTQAVQEMVPNRSTVLLPLFFVQHLEHSVACS